jgi:TetR/AcrR family transcriptional regulator, regulator of cefoperazone and chloramphenicol sensitivity
MKRLFGDQGIMAAPDQEMHHEVNGRSVQDRLIEAAEDLFCRRGFNETSVRDIAAAADCNVASINYYFGGKDNLYREIWRRRLVQMRDTRLASIAKVMSAGRRARLEDLLRSYATAFLEPLVGGTTYCRFINLMAREMIDPHLPRQMFLEEMVVPVMTALREALMTICPYLNERSAGLIILSVVGQLIHTICAKEMFEQSGHPQAPTLDLEELVDHVVLFSAAGIRAYAGESGK